MSRTSNGGQNDAPALSKELKEIACRELGETPEIKRAALEQLRKLLSGDPLLQCPEDDAFLTKFLRARKYDVEKAFKNIRKYFEARKKQPDIFADLNPASIPFDTVCRKHQLVTLSRGRDPNGIPVVLAHTAGWNTDICSLSDLLRVCAVHMEYFLLDEEVQIKGMIVVFDMKGLGLHHIPYFTPSFVRRVVSLLQDCFPMRMKAVYVINNPVLFDMIFAIARTVLKSKLIQRVQLLGYNVEKIRSLIPDDLVPEANGGTFESYDYDETERELHSRADFFRGMCDFGYRDALKHSS